MLKSPTKSTLKRVHKMHKKVLKIVQVHLKMQKRPKKRSFLKKVEKSTSKSTFLSWQPVCDAPNADNGDSADDTY